MKADVFVPLITPISVEGEVCGASVARLIASLRHSAAGFIPCLTSGEGWRLTEMQWSAMLALTLEHAGSTPVVVGIEQPSTAQVLPYAEKASRLGASGIMLTSPFGKSVDQDSIFKHYQQIHDAVDLDIYIYNESSLSGNETSFDTLLSIAALPRVAGIKDSAEKIRDVNEIRALQERNVKYFAGWEHHLGIGLPIDGCVVSLANLEPTLCRLGVACENDVVKTEVQRLTDTYQLLSEDWYAHVKAELYSRGIISSPQAVGMKTR